MVRLNFSVATFLSCSFFSMTIAVSAPALADGLRLPVGDLSNPAAARDFDRRLADAARQFCEARYSPMELEQGAACRRAIREEGLAQLTAPQRIALSRALGRPVELARATR